MGIRLQEEEKTITIFLKQSFHKLSLVFISILLPLSFLLLTKLTSLTTSSSPTYISILLHANSIFLRLLASSISLSTLLHALTGYHPVPKISIAWAMLCTLQACVTLGIEAAIAAGVKETVDSSIADVTWIEVAIFFVGLHETTLMWVRMFVRPVADDAIFSVSKEERSSDRLAVGASFCILWFWMLKDGLKPLMLAAEKEVLGLGRGWDGFVHWLVGYVTIIIGLVTIMEGSVWMMVKLCFLFCREKREDHVVSAPDDDKVRG